MKKTVLLLFAVMAAVLANAQDVITLANGESFYATNIRFADNKVFFTRISDNGNTRTPVELSTKDLSKIIYESGEEEYFRKEDPNAKVNYNNGVNTGVNNGNAVNVTVTAPTFNNGNNGGGRPQQQYGGRQVVYEGPTSFLDNPHFNAYAEAVGALFGVNNMNNTKIYGGLNGSAGVRLNDYLFVGAGTGIYFGRSNVKTIHSSEWSTYTDVPNWYVPLYLDFRGFYPVTDDLGLGGEFNVGVEFNQYSGKKKTYSGEKCGKLHLKLGVAAEIGHISASIGLMTFASMYREERYGDFVDVHTHTIEYIKEIVPAFYIKVGYRFGE